MAIAWPSAIRGADTATLGVRAERSFRWKEWSSAAAMYQLLLRDKPDSTDLYVHAIVASQMIPDTVACVELVERAMNNDLGLAPVLAGVKTLDFSIGEGDVYGQFLYTLRNAMPWMARGLDNELLNYYIFRSDGPMVEKYALKMLNGLPDSVEFLSALARGYMLQDKMEQASDIWKRILQLDPDNYETLLYLGNYYALKAMPSEALPILRRAEAIRHTPYVADMITTLSNPEHK